MQNIHFQVQDLLISLKDFNEKLKILERNCTDCLHFKEEVYFCNHYRATVPAKVIVTGCDSFYIDIPF